MDSREGGRGPAVPPICRRLAETLYGRDRVLRELASSASDTFLYVFKKGPCARAA